MSKKTYPSVADFQLGCIAHILSHKASAEFLQWVSEALLESWERHGVDDDLFVEEIEDAQMQALGARLGHDILRDGHGSYWTNWCEKCEADTLVVCRPGKVRCSRCGC